MKQLLRSLLLAVAVTYGLGTAAQTTISTIPPLTANNGSTAITFEVSSSSGVNITGIANTFNTGSISAQVWYRPGGVLHAGATTPNVTTANGWIQAGAVTVNSTSNTTPTNIPITNLNIPVNAGTSVGICVTGGTRYMTYNAALANTFTGGGATINTGPTYGFGGGFPSPTIATRSFVGSITVVPQGPCINPPYLGSAIATPDTVCSGAQFTLGIDSLTGGTGQTFQWQISSDGLSWTNIPGATSAGYNASQTTSNYYRCYATCTASDTSSPVFVHVLSSIVTPYTQDFDGSPASNSTQNPGLTDCWQYYETPGHAGYGYTYSFLTPNSTPNHFRFYNSSNTTDTLMIISPPVTGLTNSDKQVRFFASSQTSSYTSPVSVGTMANPSDPSTLNLLGTVQAPQNYQEFIVTLDSASGYNGTDQYIVIAYVNSTTFRNLYVDDITFEAIPPCPKPSLVSVGTVTATTANLSWLSGGTEFVIEYGPAGFIQGSGLLDTVNTNNATLTGLAPNTNYDAYILNDCSAAGNGLSVWTGPITFATACNTISTYPFTENFDGSAWITGTPGTIDQCWNRDQTASNPRWQVNSGGTGSSNTGPAQAYSGSNYVYLETSGGTTGSTSYLELPVFDLSSLTVPYFSFYYHMYGAAMGSLVVEVSVDTGATWTAVLTKTGQDQTASTDPFKREFVNLAAYKTAHTLVRFAGVRGTSFTSDMSLEDVRMEEAPACPDPTGLVVSAITSGSAQLNWVSTDSVFLVEYGPCGFTQGTGAIDTVFSTSAMLTGLVGNTDYEAYVYTDCSAAGSGISSGAKSSCFTTLCDALSLPITENFDNTPTGSTINPSAPDCWTYYETPGASGYGYTYGFLTPNSPPNHWRVYNSSGLTDTIALISPAIQGFTNGDVRVKFFAKTNTTAYDVNIIIGTVTNAGDMSSLSIVDTVLATQNYQEFEVYLDTASGYNGIDNHIVFMHGQGPSPSPTFDFFYLDDITIEQIPACTPPWNLASSNITSSTVDLSWSSISGGTFQIEYGLTGFIQGTGNQGTIVNNTTSPHTLTGLLPGTTYDVYVSDDCDTTNVTGPLTFTTGLDWDISLDALDVPLNVCGDSITEIKAAVTNNGINTITNLPITIDVTGGITATISTTSTTPIAPGASDTIMVGSFNTYAGGVGVLIEGYTSLANDQKLSNDTIMVGPGDYIPAEPQYFPEDSVCANVDSGFFAAFPIPGIIYGWYANAADTVPAATGDTFNFPMSGQQTWYLAYEQSADSLETTFAGGNGQSGNAFEILPTNSLTIQGLDIHIGGIGTEDVSVYYFLGSVGTSPGTVSWVLHETFTGVQGAGVGNPTNIQFTNPLNLPGGQVSSMVVVLTSSTNIDYTNGATVGGVLAQNSDLIVYEGWGVSYGTATAPVGGTFSPRNWNGRIYYGSSGCSTIKKSLTIGVNNDTAVASAFQTNVQSNGADVDFDATGSIGDVYTWDFGDGNSGTGMMTSHTYAAGGTYTVCLTVEDTTCGSIDSVCQTVVTTIGLEENLINQTMAVYPNPNNGNFRVEFQVEGLKEVELRVVSLLGQVMYESKPGNVSGTYREEIDLSQEAAGVYVLQVVSDDATISRRITIRK